MRTASTRPIGIRSKPLPPDEPLTPDQPAGYECVTGHAAATGNLDRHALLSLSGRGLIVDVDGSYTGALFSK
jgi:hypothetical protein